ncbi:LuxR family transcriptional regulator [Neorhizobium sp. SOG26]|uniref:helix-turn-helix transcriptional regulator n=1 Tax=Neorhizobium sp. SOG26 TaxID=2060726 RepID=UPI000E5687B0|nr:LuxR family transcriptional regulator [Neorhizobium sp. SOG26]AXV15919.1 LuxR family transcriptional regulator [Neorhizobium sp. SOG26]
MITLERQSILSSEISAVDCPEDIGPAFARITQAFGFRYYLLLNALSRPQEASLARLVIEGDLPEEYIQEYDRQRLLSACPIAAIVAKSPTPVSWSIDEPDDLRGFSFPDAIIELQRSHAIGSGVAMAFRSLAGPTYTTFIFGSRPRLTQDELNEMGMILLHAFGAFERLNHPQAPAAPASLTTRELEVVRWTAQGKTSAEIGRILSLSDHTVNAYMSNAIKKLDCVNRTQLVAKALRLRLIN